VSAAALHYVKNLRTAPTGEPFTLPERALLLYLADAHNEKNSGGAWPKVNTLAEFFRVTRRSIQRHLAALVRKGVIHAEKRHQRDGRLASNRWYFTHIDGPQSLADHAAYRKMQSLGRKAMIRTNEELMDSADKSQEGVQIRVSKKGVKSPLRHDCRDPRDRAVAT
jgi:Helix-turn-helix domain